MATTAIMTGLESLVANLPSKVNELSSRSRTASSSSSSFSQIKKEVERLCRMVKWIQALLDDAEEREIMEKSIKIWLDELRDVAYDAEDVVEEFEQEMLQYQLVHKEKEDDQNPHQKRGTKRKRQKQIIAKIKDINNRFDEIYKCRHGLKLSKKDGKRRKKQKLVRRMPTSSLLGDSPVHGRDDDKDEVVDMLLSSEFQEHGTKDVSVVSIVGMGGIGKTTLAQLVYRDGRVKDHFKVRLWVCVSDCFDVVKLTKEILEEVIGKTTDLHVFNLLHEKLQDNLKGKRFLLVLDDLWNENLGQWEALWKPLSSGAAGSKVLITTRNKEVSRISGAIRTHHLEGLLEDDCWSLFAQCAFGCKNPGDHPNLASIGKKIVRKCGGLPLAIRTLGGLLFNESEEDRWNAILESDIWELPEEKNDILPALRLSYHYLPSPIKPCFAFCAIFPKDHVFKMKELVAFWMALGYIKPTRGRCMEDVGRTYFEDLWQRSFFQDFSDECLFKMHDLIHDLALSVCGPECSTIEEGKLFNDASRKVRHVLFNCRLTTLTSLSCGSTNKFQYLRTFNLMNGWSMESKVVLDDMLWGMKYLRVLYLDMSISELPDSVGNLRHLRYLSVCGKFLHRLPETLGNLLNLQTLTVKEAETFKELPKRLKDLVNLRHLDLGDNSLSMIPRGIGRLTQLRTLPNFIVGEGIDAAGIEELKHLNDLQESLAIEVRSLNNWVNREPNILIHKKGLKTLSLHLNDLEDTCEDESSSLSSMVLLQEELLELIQPHTNMRVVSVVGYIGSRLPKWMGCPSYSGLKFINLHGCKNCRFLPAFGQLPSLESLMMSAMHGLTSMGREFLGDGVSVFPSLKQLILFDLPELERLLCIGTEDGGAFPRLHDLGIGSCPKLMYVKLRHLTALRKLDIGRCDELIKLDFCHASISPSSSSSSQVAVHHMHIHRVHTMLLVDCPKLSFPPAEQQQLPSSLRVLDAGGCPLLMEWIASHKDKLVGVPWLYTDAGFCPQTGDQRHLALCNVKDVEEAEAVKLFNVVKVLEKLEIRWDLEQHWLSSTEAEQVLEALDPYCSPLPVLLIEGYRGRRFPNWVGWPYVLPNLVKMTLSGCVRCERLPPLGQLPSLRKLHVSYMYEVEHVGHEFFAEEKWQQINGAPFPNLRLLTIDNCPKLRTFQLPSGLPSSSSDIVSLNPLPLLKALRIRDCPELISFIGMHEIPSLRLLILAHCPALHFSQEAQVPPQLQFASIQDSPLLSGWFHGQRISHLRVLWLNGNRVVSDGMSNAEIFNYMSEMIEGE